MPPADGRTTGPHQRIADRLRDVFAGRTVIDAQTWRDAERWLDDGGDVRAEALDLPTTDELLTATAARRVVE